MNKLSISLLAAPIYLFACVAYAGSYLMSPDGVPVKDSVGQCIKLSIQSNQQLQPGCDPMDRIILLPDAEGKVGAVLATIGTETLTVDQAYGTLRVGGEGRVESATASKNEVDAQFGQLLASQPPPPTSFVVRFVTGSATELTPDSAAVIQAMLTDLANRPAPEIRVVGHTDSVGSIEANDRLSKQRAETVVDILGREGISLDLLEAAGRGERELAVQTGDNVAEPDNRRVEIIVR
ncbi:OmpA family protein [Marinobacterium sp. YM272]|uniref:OmpA family protein n=1 Tax=Marinobacterium sp. YM272 TaxID=3421654 RepID=UPI003D7F26C4